MFDQLDILKNKINDLKDHFGYVKKEDIITTINDYENLLIKEKITNYCKMIIRASVENGYDTYLIDEKNFKENFINEFKINEIKYFKYEKIYYSQMRCLVVFHLFVNEKQIKYLDFKPFVLRFLSEKGQVNALS